MCVSMGESEAREYLYMLTYIHECPTPLEIRWLYYRYYYFIIKEEVHFLVLNYSAFSNDWVTQVYR